MFQEASEQDVEQLTGPRFERGVLLGREADTRDYAQHVQQEPAPVPVGAIPPELRVDL